MIPTQEKQAVIGVVMQVAAGRYGRERIDMPLVFASMDMATRVFLLDGACCLLFSERGGEFGWTRLWGAVAELEVDICVLEQHLRQYGVQPGHLPFGVTVMSDQQMAEAMAGCRHLIDV